MGSDIFQSFTLTDEERRVYATVKAKFEEHFVKRENVIYERAMFNRRKQEEGETVITALYTQAAKCNYGTLKEEMIRDRIVVGIRDSGLSLKLQLDSELTLNKAVTQVRDTEAVKKQQPLIQEPSAKDKDKALDTVQSKRPSSNKKQYKSRSSCQRYGKFLGHDKQHCPAKETTCHRCGKKGHFKSKCKTKHIQGVLAEQDVFLGVVHSKQETQWTIELQLINKPTEFQIDTGTEASLISEKAYKRAGNPPLSPAHQTFRGANGHIISVMGQFQGTLTKGSVEVEQQIYVVKGLHKPLLGQPAIQALGLVKIIDEIRTTQLNPIEQFPELFRGLGKLQPAYSIKLHKEAKPFTITINSMTSSGSPSKESERTGLNGIPGNY